MAVAAAVFIVGALSAPANLKGPLMTGSMVRGAAAL